MEQHQLDPLHTLPFLRPHSQHKHTGVVCLINCHARGQQSHRAGDMPTSLSMAYTAKAQAVYVTPNWKHTEQLHTCVLPGHSHSDEKYTYGFFGHTPSRLYRGFSGPVTYKVDDHYPIDPNLLCGRMLELCVPTTRCSLICTLKRGEVGHKCVDVLPVYLKLWKRESFLKLHSYCNFEQIG